MSDLFGETIAAPAVSTLGRSMAGGGDQAKRKANDFYPTPPEVTRALLRVEMGHLTATPGPIWEPCGRGGAIIRELQAAGFGTTGSDLVPDPEHGVVEMDLLRADVALAKKVITNPPFVHAGGMIERLLGRLEVDYLALLLKSQFWHAEERRPLFEKYRPARIWALTWRPDFLGGGAPTMECAWTVGQRGHEGGTVYDVLPKHEAAERLL